MQQSETTRCEAPLKSFDDMSLDEIAGEITEWFREICESPVKNLAWNRPRAEAIARSVIVSYDINSYGFKLSRAEAEQYLAWLRRGNYGNHTAAGVYHWKQGPQLA